MEVVFIGHWGRPFEVVRDAEKAFSLFRRGFAFVVGGVEYPGNSRAGLRAIETEFNQIMD